MRTPAAGAVGCDQNSLTSRRERRLDDEELDSGDDEGREDRIIKTLEGDGDEQGVADEEEEAEENAKIMDLHLGRHAVPESTDGQVCARLFLYDVDNETILTMTV